MTGYKTYTRDELIGLESSRLSHLKQERWIAEGTGLSAEIAQANVREFEKQLIAIRKELQKQKV
jgi:hypothetical protein